MHRREQLARKVGPIKRVHVHQAVIRSYRKSRWSVSWTCSINTGCYEVR